MAVPYPINRFINAMFPLLFVAMGTFFGTVTFADLLLFKGKPSLAFNFSRWSDESFARLWRFFGPISAKKDLKTVPQIVGVAQGVVVDLGPGSGQNVMHFDRKRLTKLWLIEPNQGMHPLLQENLKKAGLDDIATIIPCGAEDHAGLLSHGLAPSSADTIVTVKVLCSVPKQAETCRALYTLLKPGGSWLVFEHVVVKPEYYLARLLQSTYQTVWPILLGGCNLTRDTAKSLKDAGKWSKVELGRPAGEIGWEMLGHIVGRLEK